MENKLIAVKASMAAACTAVFSFLGWKGILALGWILVMALDYLSGTAAACKDGEWASGKAREGLWHKFGMIFAVMVAGIADWIMALWALVETMALTASRSVEIFIRNM